ncbi:hypothetical protein [Sulfurimonas sp.]|nr:hypothetical protein [Sulfurimonas sp.]
MSAIPSSHLLNEDRRLRALRGARDFRLLQKLETLYNSYLYI